MQENEARQMYREEGKEFGFQGAELRAYVTEQITSWLERKERQDELDRQEREAERKERQDEAERQERLETLRTNSQSHQPESTPRKIELKVRKFDDSEDIDGYLHAFEQIAKHNGWHEEDWAVALQQGLANSKAMSIFAHFSVEELKNYAAVKKELLTFFSLTTEEYRKRVLNAKQNPNETFRQYAKRIKRY